MNLRDSVDDYADLDAQLQQADTGALATLDRLLDVESTLVIVKQAAKAERGVPTARVESAASKPTP